MSMLGRMNPIVFQLCYPDPPLRSNKRMHWRAEHRIKADIRQVGLVQAKKWMHDNPGTYPIPHLVDIVMVWHVPTRHRRDPDAGQPTLKSWVDGITVGTKAHPGAGLLHDDSWVWTRRMWCEIAYSPNEPMQLTVEIREVAGG